MSYRQTLDFLLYDWLDVEALRERARFADHSRETFDAVLDTCERIAREKFAPFNRLADTEEPWFDGEKVHLPQATPRRGARPTSSPACSPRRRTTRSAACSCPASSRWRPTASSRRPASASAAAAC